LIDPVDLSKSRPLSSATASSRREERGKKEEERKGKITKKREK